MISQPGGVVADAERVGVNLAADVEVSQVRDLQDRKCLGAELQDVFLRQWKGDGFGLFPISELVSTEAGADGVVALRRTPFNDGADELETVVNCENLLPIDEAEQPHPGRTIEEQFPNVVAARIRIEAGWHDEAKASTRLQ